MNSEMINVLNIVKTICELPYSETMHGVDLFNIMKSKYGFCFDSIIYSESVKDKHSSEEYEFLAIFKVQYKEEDDLVHIDVLSGNVGDAKEAMAVYLYNDKFNAKNDNDFNKAIDYFREERIIQISRAEYIESEDAENQKIIYEISTYSKYEENSCIEVEIKPLSIMILLIPIIELSSDEEKIKLKLSDAYGYECNRPEYVIQRHLIREQMPIIYMINDFTASLVGQYFL